MAREHADDPFLLTDDALFYQILCAGDAGSTGRLTAEASDTDLRASASRIS